MTTRQLLVSTWDCNPMLVGICLLALLGYAELTHRSLRGCSAFFFAGVAVFFLTLASPLNFLAAGYLFSAHMLQHLLLLLVVPPLLLLGLPEWESSIISRSTACLRKTRIHPLAAWLAGLGAMWIWHERSLCDVATTTQVGRVIQIISLVVLGALFWWPIVGPQTHRRLVPLLGIVYLFSACVGCTILGILITFAPAGAVCPAFLHPLDRLGVLPLVQEQWGITPAKDQQVGGLMMWVPACGIYLSGVITLLTRWYRSGESTHAEPQKAVNEPAPVFSSTRTTRERA